MSAIVGWYYLHENGEVIYKPGLDAAADIRDSSLARAMWPCDPTDRKGAWNICVEALAFGARKDRVLELATKWNLDDKDGLVYAEVIKARVDRDGSSWCASRQDFEDLATSPAGFGDTVLEALAALAKELKLPAGKMWNPHLEDLLRERAA